MRRKSLTDAPCPIARSLDEVGEWWSILILRDAFRGLTRFDEFQRSIGLATNMLTRRLQSLVEAGLLERHPYQERPVRHEYRLTAKGRDFLPVVVALAAWGSRWTMPDGAFRFVSPDSGRTVDPVVVDRETGEPITAASIRIALDPSITNKTDGEPT